MQETPIYVYACKKRSALIDINNFTEIDRHLIVALHDESIYDVLTYVGTINESDLMGYITQEELKRLKEYKELIVRGKQAKNILERFKTFENNIGYLILRLFNK